MHLPKISSAKRAGKRSVKLPLSRRTSSFIRESNHTLATFAKQVSAKPIIFAGIT
jgi:hypothetical protein